MLTRTWHFKQKVESALKLLYFDYISVAEVFQLSPKRNCDHFKDSRLSLRRDFKILTLIVERLNSLAFFPLLMTLFLENSNMFEKGCSFLRHGLQCNAWANN